MIASVLREILVSDSDLVGFTGKWFGSFWNTDECFESLLNVGD